MQKLCTICSREQMQTCWYREPRSSSPEEEKMGGKMFVLPLEETPFRVLILALRVFCILVSGPLSPQVPSLSLPPSPPFPPTRQDVARCSMHICIRLYGELSVGAPLLEAMLLCKRPYVHYTHAEIICRRQYNCPSNGQVSNYWLDIVAMPASARVNELECVC